MCTCPLGAGALHISSVRAISPLELGIYIGLHTYSSIFFNYKNRPLCPSLSGEEVSGLAARRLVGPMPPPVYGTSLAATASFAAASMAALAPFGAPSVFVTRCVPRVMQPHLLAMHAPPSVVCLNLKAAIRTATLR